MVTKQAPPLLGVCQALESLLATLELNEADQTNAAIARALAAKLDESANSTTATAALAVAGIAKELRDVVQAICEATDDAEGFVADLFSQVGDSADTKAADPGRSSNANRRRTGDPADAVAAARPRRRA